MVLPSLAVSGNRSEFEYAITCFKPFQPKNEDAPVMESSSGIVPDETSSMPLYSLKFLPSTVSAILSPYSIAFEIAAVRSTISEPPLSLS